MNILKKYTLFFIVEQATLTLQFFMFYFLYFFIESKCFSELKSHLRPYAFLIKSYSLQE